MKDAYHWERKVVSERHLVELADEIWMGRGEVGSGEALAALLHTLKAYVSEKMLRWMEANPALAKRICCGGRAESEGEEICVLQKLREDDMRHLYYIWLVKNGRIIP